MGRWEPDAQGRLVEAATELYEERGFEATTVSDIAERAGLTRRTFFRYFPDKREVLFRGSEEFERLIVEGAAGAPAGATPLEAAGAGLEAAAEMLQDRRDFARRRQAILAANPELQERELRKLDSVGSKLAEGLRGRDLDERQAALTAHVAMAVLQVAFSRWATGSDSAGLPAVMRETLEQLSTVTAGVGARG